MSDNLAEILRPGRVLSEADVVALSERLEPAWRARERRLDARDEAVRAAVMLYRFPTLSGRAKALALDLRHYLARGPMQHHEAAAQIVELNDGRALGDRQIRTIVTTGERR